MKNLSGIVLTYNSERRIRECLTSLDFCEKVYVIDSFSTDKTQEIAHSFSNVVFIQNTFENYSKQRKFSLLQVKTDWAIVLDSDEFCSHELKEKIFNFFKNAEYAENNDFSAAFVCRRSFFFNKFLSHSDAYPDYLLRLFKVQDTFISDSQVHEEIKTKGKTTTLSADIIHYPYTSFKNYLDKLNHYADISAKEKTQKGQKFSLSRAIFHALWGFIRIYFVKKGILDGKAGFIMATHHAFYVYMKYIRIGENEGTFGLTHNKK